MQDIIILQKRREMKEFEEVINSKFDSQQRKALLHFRYVSNMLNSMSNDFFKEFNVSSQQFNVLRILRGAKKPLPVHVIKERMIEKNTEYDSFNG